MLERQRAFILEVPRLVAVEAKPVELAVCKRRVATITTHCTWRAGLDTGVLRRSGVSSWPARRVLRLAGVVLGLARCLACVRQ